MRLLIAIATTYKDILNNGDGGTIYSGAYTLFQSLLQGIFSVLQDAGIYLAGSVISVMGAAFMIFGQNAKVIAELKEDMREKLVVVLLMSSVVSFVGFILTMSYGAGI